MVEPWLAINNIFLFLCTSMYLGTGWSLVLFSFPTAPRLRPDNYYDQFVPQVTVATKFFTVMTALMVALAIAMIIGGPADGWVLGAIVLAAVVAATVLTVIAILPDNRRMAAGIKTQPELDTILHRWMVRNRIRVGLWTVQWSAMAVWFGIEVTR